MAPTVVDTINLGGAMNTGGVLRDLGNIGFSRTTDPKIFSNNSMFLMVYADASGSIKSASSINGFTWVVNPNTVHNKAYFQGIDCVKASGSFVQASWSDCGDPINQSPALSYSYIITGSITIIPGTSANIAWGTPAVIMTAGASEQLFATSNEIFAGFSWVSTFGETNTNPSYIQLHPTQDLTLWKWYIPGNAGLFPNYIPYAGYKFNQTDPNYTYSSMNQLQLHADDNPSGSMAILGGTECLPTDNPASLYWTLAYWSNPNVQTPFFFFGSNDGISFPFFSIGNYRDGFSEYTIGIPPQHSTVLVDGKKLTIVYDVGAASNKGRIESFTQDASGLPAFYNNPPSTPNIQTTIIDPQIGNSFPGGSRDACICLDKVSGAKFVFYTNSGSDGNVRIRVAELGSGSSQWLILPYIQNIGPGIDPNLNCIKVLKVGDPRKIPFAWLSGSSIVADSVNAPLISTFAHTTDSFIRGGATKSHKVDTVIVPNASVFQTDIRLYSGSTFLSIVNAEVRKNRHPRIATISIPNRSGDFIQVFGSRQYEIDLLGSFANVNSNASVTARKQLSIWQGQVAILSYFDEEFPFGLPVIVERMDFDYAPGYIISDYIPFKIKLLSITAPGATGVLA